MRPDVSKPDRRDHCLPTCQHQVPEGLLRHEYGRLGTQTWKLTELRTIVCKMLEGHSAKFHRELLGVYTRTLFQDATQPQRGKLITRNSACLNQSSFALGLGPTPKVISNIVLGNIPVKEFK